MRKPKSLILKALRNLHMPAAPSCSVESYKSDGEEVEVVQ